MPNWIILSAPVFYKQDFYHVLHLLLWSMFPEGQKNSYFWKSQYPCGFLLNILVQVLVQFLADSKSLACIFLRKTEILPNITVSTLWLPELPSNTYLDSINHRAILISFCIEDIWLNLDTARRCFYLSWLFQHMLK